MVIFSITDITFLLAVRLQHLRQVGVVGKFVEFFGPGVAQLSIADRATIANMCPEYGATAAFFPVDDVSLQYLEQTGERSAVGCTSGLNERLCFHSSSDFSLFCFLCLDSGREPERLAYIAKYLKAVAIFRDYNDALQDPDFTKVSLCVTLTLLHFF